MLNSTKHKTMWVFATAFVVALLAAACKPGDPGRSTGSYPIDIFQEMHYNQTYKAQEPPRFLPPAGSIPITGGFIPAPLKADAADLTSPFPENAAALERGALLYKQNCAMCHGPTAAGDGYVGTKFAFAGTPPSFDGDRIAALTPGEAYASISNGAGAMPPFQSLISEEDRWALVSLIEMPSGERASRLAALDNSDLSGEARVRDEIARALRLNELRSEQR